MKTDWSDVAKWYDDLVGEKGGEYHQEVIFPSLLKNLPKDLTNTQMLDLACGQGALCRLLASNGVKMTGIDLAANLIDAAIKYQTPNVNYYVNDATKLIDEQGNLIPQLKENQFDAIFIILAIQNISPLSPLWKACYKTLKPSGKLHIVMMHPCFRIPQFSSWQWNQKDFRQERISWKYLKSQEINIITHPGKQDDENKTIHFHRPLQAYINTLANANLFTSHINELTSHKKEQAGVKSTQLENAKKEFPLFLHLIATKIA